MQLGVGGFHSVWPYLAKSAERSYTLCMSSGVEHASRSLSARESQVMAWLEEERPAVITAADLAASMDLSRERASDVLRRMASKGWLHRVAQGSYEPLLAESGGIALPNPWAALAAAGLVYVGMLPFSLRSFRRLRAEAEEP